MPLKHNFCHTYDTTPIIPVPTCAVQKYSRRLFSQSLHHDFDAEKKKNSWIFQPGNVHSIV